VAQASFRKPAFSDVQSENDPPVVAVPFLDLAPSHQGLREELLRGFGQIIDANAFHYGPEVGAFERAFASYLTIDHCVGVGSGIDALRLALIALGLEPGDEVIVPAATFIATFAAVTQARGVPVPVDVTPDDYTVDVEILESALTSKTRAIVPVHLYGQMADMVALRAFAERHGLAILEDACQAHGATRDGLVAGTAGAAGAFSFYPGKNLGAMGDAGAVVTDDAELASRVRSLREHGERAKYDHEREGYTSRLDTIQALVLLSKLPYLSEWNAQRASAAAAYSASLMDLDAVTLPTISAGSVPVWHLYPIRTAEPTLLAAHLAQRGIDTGRHYPIPPHLSDAYGWLGHRQGSFPVTEALSREVLSLPLFPGITGPQLAAVSRAVHDFFARS
jgi:dTDP-4-amino-4,6-dideoxygalactose transaminase